MRQIKLLGVTTLLFISLFAYGQTAISGDWKTIDKKGYMIQYPDSFGLDKSAQKIGLSFILISKLTSSEDLFGENITLLIQDLKGKKINLDQYVENSEELLKEWRRNVNVLESTRLKGGDSEFQRVVYTGDKGKFNFKFLEYFFVEKGNAYILTLTCELSQFDKYKEVGEKIMSTFKIR